VLVVTQVAASASGLVLAETSALVLAPTRELAVQIDAECTRFGEPLGVASAAVYGGAAKDKQLALVSKGVHVLVATPGRLNDFLQAGSVRLDECTYVVIDEADRMLDLGFEPQIRAVLKIVGSRRQTLLFSATWPQEVQALAATLLMRPGEPHRVTIGTGGDRLTASSDVKQKIEFLTKEDDRAPTLLRHLSYMTSDARVLVFCSSKKTVEALARTLHKKKVEHVVMHGDRDQADREKALSQFRSGDARVLVATDVAARGLDIKGVEMVVNYEFPTRTEDYVHRIGRTGRAGAKGLAVTFMSAADASHAPALVKILKESGLSKEEIPKELRQMVKLMKPAAAAPKPAGASSSSGGLYDNLPTYAFKPAT